MNTRPCYCLAPCDLAEALAHSDRCRLKIIIECGKLVTNLTIRKTCPQGLTPKKALLLALVVAQQGGAISYAELADMHMVLWGVTISRTAVREHIAALKARNFFECCEQVHEGFLHGMRIICSRKTCSFLQLPTQLTHAATTPYTHQQTTPAGTGPHPPGNYSVDAPPHLLPLLLKKEEEEGAQQRYKVSKHILDDAFFDAIEKSYSEEWPVLTKNRFDFPSFVSAAKKAPDIALFKRVWRLSLDYAEFDLTHNMPIKDPHGQVIKNPYLWIAGCFQKSSHYPRPKNYATREELEKMEAELAAQVKAKQIEDELFTKEFEHWRESKTAEELREITGWSYKGEPPMQLLRAKFCSTVWSVQRHG